MDFFQIKERSTKNGTIEIYPDFKVIRSKDLMIRGKSFYAIWDEEKGLWSTDEYDVQRLVDKELYEYRDKLTKNTESSIHIKLMSEFSTRAWAQYRIYMSNLSDTAHQLDERLIFANTEVKKKDYVSRRLSYSLEKGECLAFDELMETLYDKEEREKLLWATGAIVSGDAKDIQKFIVLYGEGGTGKSTFLNIVQKLFAGYYTTFEARALTSASNTFSTEVFRANPLVAIQHDGDLSRIEDNTKLNSIISHEEMTMNEKYKPSYTARANCFLFMATNKPVKISDAKSGIIRRLIDVKPSGKKIPIAKYHSLISRIDFELGAIAHKCLDIYNSMGKNYYLNYLPLGMMLSTDVFFNFVEDNYHIFLEQDGITLTQAYSIYKVYCDETLIDFKLPRHKFREELKNYFKNFADITRINGKQVRSYYSGFITSKLISQEKVQDKEHASWINLDQTKSLFDDLGKDFPAQYANENEIPSKKWRYVKSKLFDLDTKKLHYVKVPINHIIVDFDIKDLDGKKSFEKNLEASSKFPPTYAEFSKSQAGIHLHYIYDEDIEELSNLYSEGIEVKVFNGDSSLRRKLSRCNNIPIATINSGLPLKKGEKVINFETVQSEKGLRNLIIRNLKKEIHPGTKPSIDFIYKILEDAYKNEMQYDITDLRPRILAFANNSSHQPEYCLKLVAKMKFRSEEPSLPDISDNEIIFFDVEVFPNLFHISWKYAGEDNTCVRMVNPSPKDIEELLKYRLIGFNCRRYDNHILYARYIGYEIEELYTLSQRIINNVGGNGLFGEAYGISYADVYDFSSIKQSLKKFQLQLGIHHQELGLPFDEPVSKEKWELVADYCDNDVISLEAVFNDRKQDFIARQILAELSGLTINDTTQTHTAKIIFGNDHRPQSQFVYTDLSKLFPGYKYDGKSFYRGEEPGEGGYVYAEPGYYENVALLDVASMHPTSIELLNLFGPYTDRFNNIKSARLAIKHKDYAKATKMLGGILEKYLTSSDDLDALSYALKIIINIVYGLTSARFDNKFKDPRNIDNIVAKRGALFMIDLKHAVQEKGYIVAHIKTDSIKIPNADKKIIKFVIDFGKKYGYKFEHEETFTKFCLVNDAVYVAKKEDREWTTTGAEFSHPYVFKTLFRKEPITFQDMCEIKSVTSYLYLDMNEGDLDNHNYIFIGKSGSFCPVISGGGLLMRKQNEKYYYVSGTKGYRWLESEMVKSLGKEIDIDYFRNLVDNAIKHINQYVDFELFRD